LKKSNGEVKTEFIIRKKLWSDKHERFYLIMKRGTTETALDWVTGYAGEYTFYTAKNTLLRNLRNKIQFEDATVTEAKGVR
jgi:hypothetical protein